MTEKQPASIYESFKAEPRRGRLLAEEEFILEVTEKLVEYLNRGNVSRTELANRLGVTKGYVTQILSGGKNLTLRTIADVAEALGYEPKLKLRKRKQREKLQCVSFELTTWAPHVEVRLTPAPSPQEIEPVSKTAQTWAA